jgi:hypothetical protein
MKRNELIISTTIFFLAVNSKYLWEGKLGFFAFPAFIFLVAVYILLAIVLLKQLVSGTKEKFADKKQLLVISFLTIVLTLTFLFPSGLIAFAKLEGKDLFVAQREGAANCMTEFKLKEDHKFVERSVCFGVTETKGDYALKGDTIFFSNISLGRGEKDYFAFAIIKKAESQNKKIIGNLVRYKNLSDTAGHVLWIIKNDLTK